MGQPKKVKQAKGCLPVQSRAFSHQKKKIYKWMFTMPPSDLLKPSVPPSLWICLSLCLCLSKTVGESFSGRQSRRCRNRSPKALVCVTASALCLPSAWVALGPSPTTLPAARLPSRRPSVASSSRLLACPLRHRSLLCPSAQRAASPCLPRTMVRVSHFN